jgi:hypothetical protein
MNRRTLWIGAAVLVLAAGCNRNNTDERTGSVLDSDRQARITVTGCLQAGEQGLGSREPNAAARSAEGANRFVLANATQSSSSATGSTTPLYILEGQTNVLRTHVGQQVEITGQAEGTYPSDGNEPSGQRLQVESVKMIAQRCVTG